MPRTKIDYSAVINEKPRAGRFDVEDNFPIVHSRTAQRRQLGETPREKFCNILATRTRSLTKDFAGIRKLANKETYAYDERDVAEIMNFLGEECEAVQRSFEAKREVGRALVLPLDRGEDGEG